MTLHVYVKRVDAYKAWGYCLGTAEGNEVNARVCGYLMGVIAHHEELDETEVDPEVIDFHIYADEYRGFIFGIFETLGIEAEVLQAA